MNVAVLGAGVVGVTAAWYLREAGHDVQVIDRREGPGLETSFANGGQISADHAGPWARPDVPLQALKWMLREDARRVRCHRTCPRRDAATAPRRPERGLRRLKRTPTSLR